MRHALVLALAVLAITLAGCGNDVGPTGSGGFAGTYSMDAEDFLAKMQEAMLEQLGPMLEQMPPQQVEQMKSQMLEGMKDGKVDLEIKSDGTFKMVALMQGDEDVMAGTWTEKDDVITFVQTEEDGKAKEDGEVIKATLKNGDLLLKPDAEMPFDIVMKRN